MSPSRVASRMFLGLVVLFVVGPAAMVIVDSFNGATSFPSPFQSATLHWYVDLVHHDEFVASMRVSGIVAVLAATCATALGFFAGYALIRYQLPGRNAIQTFLLGPLLVPQIVIGLAELQLFSLWGVELNLGVLVAAHTVYVMPFALRVIMASLARFDFTLEEAAYSLGAGRLRTLRHVTLPLLGSGLIGAFVFAFILSFVNLPLSLFLTNARSTTLPIMMFAYMESRIDPLIAAVASVVVIAAIATTLLLERVFRLRLLG